MGCSLKRHEYRQGGGWRLIRTVSSVRVASVPRFFPNHTECAAGRERGTGGTVELTRFLVRSGPLAALLLLQRKVEDLDGVFGKPVSEAGRAGGDGGGEGNDLCWVGDGVRFLRGFTAESYYRGLRDDAVCAVEFDGDGLRDR